MKNTEENKMIGEGNRLIADFMNQKFPDDYRIDSTYIDREYGNISCNYHSSWNWLMPVVEKIESLGGDVVIYYRSCSIMVKEKYYNDLSQSTSDFNKIYSTYKAVVKFIKWYSSQPQNVTDKK